MDADSAGELRIALEALETRLAEAADWIVTRDVSDDELSIRVFGPKRSAVVLDAFRDALNAGAFADDEVMQDERARAFPDDVRPKAKKRKASSEEIPVEITMVGRTIGCWIGYVPHGNSQSMFIERLLRGWVRLFDFGKPRSQADVVELPIFRELTVEPFVTGLRCLARAVRVEIDRRCPPSQTIDIPSDVLDEVRAAMKELGPDAQNKSILAKVPRKRQVVFAAIKVIREEGL